MYLELTGVRKMYHEDNGVKHIDLAVEKGMLLTLLGPSGCGKTTLLNLLGGFLKPDVGSIFLDGQEITSHVPEERPVSTVFQSYALFPHMNVLENVCYGLRFFHRMKKRDVVPVAEKYLDIVGLSEYAKTSVTALSGAQQQRVALARAMATEPKVLLLDEPLSNLDASLRLRMRGELKRLQQKTGMTGPPLHGHATVIPVPLFHLWGVQMTGMNFQTDPGVNIRPPFMKCFSASSYAVLIPLEPAVLPPASRFSMAVMILVLSLPDAPSSTTLSDDA